ncbi:Asp/Glu racemase [Halococcus sp. IIIV-5B]|nr:Asp/Glu racemase [Halococcus sp. IIIV-5B]RJT07913.1 Asp/Glu racemase [Halococcus sp. IIIV-5B]
METEIPAMLRGRPAIYDESYTFHSSRMRMQEVTPEELRRMDEQSEKCAIELADARCDVLAYACLIGIMAQGPGYHEESETSLYEAAAENGGEAPVVTSAGALVRAFDALEAQRVAVITPYLQHLTDTVVDYFEGEGIDVVDSISLECPDNLEVAKLDPADLLDHMDDLDHEQADAVVLSSCVQMPSLPSIQAAEDRLGKPVLSASVATTYDILNKLGRSTRVSGAGKLLSGGI